MKHEIIILTQNQILADKILSQYNIYHLEKIKPQNLSPTITSWKTPIILSFKPWLQNLWHSNLININHPEKIQTLLTRNQELLIWKNIISNSSHAISLLQATETANLAQDAFNLLKNWHITLTHSLLQIDLKGKILYDWMECFISFCKKNNLIDFSSLTDKIIALIQTERIKLPDCILLAGFTEKTPQQQNLFTAIKQANCEIRDFTPNDYNLIINASSSDHINNTNYSNKQDNQINKIYFSHLDEEIKTLALWAKNLLHLNKNINIGCVTTQLTDLQPKLLNIFSEIFSAPNILANEHDKLPFEIYHPKKLIEYPIINIAVLYINAIIYNLSNEEISRLEKSVFANKNLSRHFVASLSNNTYPIYQEIFFTVTQTKPETKLKSAEWVKHISLYLQKSGWPHKFNLTTLECNLVERWFEMLNEYAALADILPQHNLEDAISAIKQLTTNTYNKINQHISPIKIISPEAAIGQQFDYLWIMGMNDSQWPKVRKPNTLIPLALQQLFNLPDSNPQDSLSYTKKIFNLLCEENNNLILSFTKHIDGIDLRPSFLLTEIPEITSANLNLASQESKTKLLFETRKSEWLEDQVAPHVQSSEKLRGGSSILKYQAACPFKAYAEIRLHALSNEPSQLGLKASDRGNILHKTLELIWKNIQNSETLQQLSNNNLKLKCEQSAFEAILIYLNNSPNASSKNNLPPLKNADLTTIRQMRASDIEGYFLSNPNPYKYLHIEWLRIAKLALQWLNLEKNRPPFKILKLEESISIKLADLTFNLRIDRIDEVSNGNTIIIDYKTGKNTAISDWLGDRPTEPQLPLYSIYDTEKTTAIAYASLHPENIGFRGISAQYTGIDNLNSLDKSHTESGSKTTKWQAQITAWKNTLTKLSHEFYNGNAIVDPKSDLQTCTHCGLQTLCRIYTVKNSI